MYDKFRRDRERRRVLACNQVLWSHVEQEVGICNRCADREYERYKERLEFEHYHPSGDD